MFLWFNRKPHECEQLRQARAELERLKKERDGLAAHVEHLVRQKSIIDARTLHKEWRAANKPHPSSYALAE